MVKKKASPVRHGRFRIKKRLAKYVMGSDVKIEYKDIALLQRYITDRGKILSRRVTGITGKQQSALSVSVKRARYLGLLPVGSVKKR